MIGIAIGLGAIVGGAYWLHKLTETMNMDTRIRYGIVAALLVVGGALVG